MTTIVPAILTKDEHDLRQKLDILAPWAPAVHIDVADGQFVANQTLSYDQMAPILKESRLPIELHLMVAEPWAIAERAQAAQTARILIHAETLPKPDDFLKRIAVGWPLGLVFNLATPWGVWENHCEKLQEIMLMSIEPGWQGKAFDSQVLERLEFLSNHCSKVVTSVDGGINATTIRAVAGAGAQRIVVGSAIWKNPNPEKAYQELCSLVS